MIVKLPYMREGIDVRLNIIMLFETRTSSSKPRSLLRSAYPGPRGFLALAGAERAVRRSRSRLLERPSRSGYKKCPTKAAILCWLCGNFNAKTARTQRTQINSIDKRFFARAGNWLRRRLRKDDELLIHAQQNNEPHYKGIPSSTWSNDFLFFVME